MLVAVAGDWHGNTGWALSAVDKIAYQLRDEPVKRIYQLGDFGIWPGKSGVKYRQKLEKRLARHEITVHFVDGNHEKFPYLYGRAEEQGLSTMGNLVQITPHIFWMQRGYRFMVGNRVWLAAGGGVSIDRVLRKEGISYWPEEFITPEQLTFIKNGGVADVVLSHDQPSGIGKRNFKGALWPLPDLARNEAHRDIVQEIRDSVLPYFWMHGHLHYLYELYSHGTRYTGLARDTMDGNWLILDTDTMNWKYIGKIR